MNINQKLQYAIRLPFERKIWFFCSIITSLFVWTIIKFFKVKFLHSFMGSYSNNTLLSMIATKEQSLKAWRIARVVEAVCRGVPWECKCLTEAICTNIILKLYKIPSVFYLGSKIDNSVNKELKAHAWLTVGQYCVIGGEVAQDGYIVTATFTTPNLFLATKSKA
jgi:hypothetical protein